MAGSAAEERLRALAVAQLRRERPVARICHELNVAGSGSTRLDLAAVDEDHLTLVEIKSEKDTLGRLKDQLAQAHKRANEVWVVFTIRHAEPLKQALSFGDGGGYSTDYELFNLLSRTRLLIENTAGELQLFEAFNDRVELSPEPRHIWGMMWAGEMVNALRPWGYSGSMGPMTRFAVENLTGREIRRATCAALRGRPFARADAPIGAVPAAPAVQLKVV